MNATFYWHKLSKCLMIKTALPHLLLGVIATGFSFSYQPSLHVQTTVSSFNISTIVQKHQVAFQNHSAVGLNARYHNNPLEITPVYTVILTGKSVRLTPNNGIRAGPIFFA